MSGTVALVVAAGRGNRFGAEVPKQYAALGGQPLLRHSLEAFARHARVDAVTAVIHAQDRDLYARAAAGLDLPEPAIGGATRQDSARNGLERIAVLAPDIVLIHDGARPFVSTAVIDRVLDALRTAAGAVAARPVTDTLKREAGGRIAGTVARAGLWRAQTPQGFRFAEILAAHRAAAGAELTDDAAVAERAGLTVVLIEGAAENLKVTTRDDLARAERWLAGSLGEVRVGHGFDAHRFGPGDRLMLCGVAVPHEAGLRGHSDADVGLHALTDAILGAIGGGDIGSHFPPSDTRWRGAESALFVRHARDMVAARGGRIAHVDVTLVCERPKVGPHRAAMATRIAELLGIDAARVSVKATTTDGLGFTGRREGVAAQATATVRLPGAPW
ncbi:MAG: bifunctional 2-C-methyl-D-erythritol 4-phosphate cytidylyltransferase/2-C-methyl-D-erythritol 2,4-cyclodiphosphate synthase [Kiloniellaceae bacterium]